MGQIYAGKRIKELRGKNEILIEDVASKTRLTVEQLRHIEDGHVHPIDNLQLVSICDSIGPILLTDYINIINLNKKPLQFKCCRVGLLQSGSNAMRLMFDRNYLAEHEFMVDASCNRIKRYINNKITYDDIRKFILTRDMTGHCEFDSAYYLHYFMPILSKHFQDIKFIFNIRDCFSWFNCILNYILNHRLSNNEYNGQLEIGLSECYINNRDELIGKIPFIIDDILSFWSNENEKILEMLPEGRSLIVRTHEIYDKINEIAQFMEIPVESLDRGATLAFPKEKNHGMLHEINYDFLYSRFTEHCSKLMARFYPDYTLDDFLAGNYLTNIKIYCNE